MKKVLRPNWNDRKRGNLWLVSKFRILKFWILEDMIDKYCVIMYRLFFAHCWIQYSIYGYVSSRIFFLHKFPYHTNGKIHLAVPLTQWEAHTQDESIFSACNQVRSIGLSRKLVLSHRVAHQGASWFTSWSHVGVFFCCVYARAHVQETLIQSYKIDFNVRNMT